MLKKVTDKSSISGRGRSNLCALTLKSRTWAVHSSSIQETGACWGSWHLHRNSIQVSKKLNHCPDGAAHIHTHLSLRCPSVVTSQCLGIGTKLHCYFSPNKHISSNSHPAVTGINPPFRPN